MDERTNSILAAADSGGIDRRTALVGGAALLATALGAARPARAQDATPAAATAPEVVLAWVDAWVAADPAAVAALYAADGVYEDVPNNHRIAAADIEASLAGYLGALGDIVVELDSAHGDAGWAVVEWTLSATNQGLFADAPAGTPFSVRNATVFALEGDAIARSADYYDNATILTQLGLLPPPGAAGTPAP